MNARLASARSLAALAFAALSQPIAAQRADIFLGAYGASVTSTSTTNSRTARFTGFLAGGQGRLRLGFLAMEFGYGEGTLDPESTGTPRKLVDGYAFAGLAPVSFFQILAGARAHSFDPVNPPDLNIGIGTRPPGGPSERWLVWQVLSRLDAPLLEFREPQVTLHAFAEGRLGFRADIDADGPFDRARGGEVGLTVRFNTPPVALRFSYEMDETAIDGLRRAENIEAITFAVGLAWPGNNRPPATALRTTPRREAGR
jgi:hypothetical protein